MPSSTAVDDPAANGYYSSYDEENSEWIFTDAPGIEPSLLFATESLISNVEDMALWIKSLMKEIMKEGNYYELISFD